MRNVRRIDASGGYGVIDPEREVMITSPWQNVPRERILGVGIVGLGAIAQRSHIPNFQTAPGGKVVAVCDIDERKARLVAAKFGIKHVFTDYEKMLNCEEVEVVSICTPHYLHAPMAIAACDAKKHVLIEKPFALSLEEAQKVIAAAQKNNVKVGCADFKIFLPEYEVTKEILKNNVIGEVMSIRTKLGHRGPEFWTPVSGKWFYSAKEARMGALLDLGMKHISLLRWLLEDEIIQVQGILKHMLKARASEVEDYAAAILEFRSGVVALLEASWCTSPSFKGTEIVGTKGSVFVDYPNTKLEVHFGGDVTGVLKPEIPEESRKGNPFHRFIDCILNNTPFDVTPEDEMRSLEVVIAIAMSSYEKRVVTLPLKESA